MALQDAVAKVREFFEAEAQSLRREPLYTFAVLAAFENKANGVYVVKCRHSSLSEFSESTHEVAVSPSGDIVAVRALP